MTNLTGEQVSMFDLDSQFGKTFQGPSAAIRAKTSAPSLKRSQGSVRTDWIYLDRCGANGLMRGEWQEMDGASRGGSMTLNTGECPSAARESTLSQILEPNAPTKYYLSAKACQGILRRAEKRGKELPTMLREALEEAVSLSKNEPESPGGGKGILPAVDRAFTLATNVDQSVCIGVDQQGGKGGAAFAEGVSPTLCSDSHGTPHGVCYSIQGNAASRDTAQNGTGLSENVAHTLNTQDRHAVCYPDKAMTLTARHDSSPCVDRGQNVVCYDARGNGDGTTAPTITGDHENRVTDYTAVAVGNGQMHQTDLGDKTGALNCMHDQQAVIHDAPPPRKYIIRRLTPLECCRLQGFPDWWTDGVDGSDSAQYKMWGNGIALPCAVDVLRRIAEAVD